MFNEDWYPDEQIKLLCDLVKTLTCVQGKVIEIGCWEGKSTYNLANAIHPDILICNDTWLGNTCENKLSGEKHITEIILKERDVYKIFLENMERLTPGNYKVVKEDCLEWLLHYNDKIKFCHIDACHDYESIYTIIILVLPKLVSGGIICGDDFLSAHIHRDDLDGGVERAVREILPNFKNYDNFWYWKKS